MKLPQPKTTAEANQLLFMKWLAKNFPAIYNAHLVAADADHQLSGFFDAIASGLKSVGSVVTQVIAAAPEIIQQYGASKAQIELIKTNLTRANAGQAPINAQGQVISAVPGTLPVNAAGNLMPVTTQTFLTFGLIGGAILLLVMLLRRKGSRRR